MVTKACKVLQTFGFDTNTNFRFRHQLSVSYAMYSFYIQGRLDGNSNMYSLSGTAYVLVTAGSEIVFKYENKSR